ISSVGLKNYHLVFAINCRTFFKSFGFSKGLMVDPVSKYIIWIVINRYQTYGNYNMVFTIFINELMNFCICRLSIRIVIGFYYAFINFNIKIYYSFCYFINQKIINFTNNPVIGILDLPSSYIGIITCNFII